MKVVGTFRTFGATDAAAFSIGSGMFVAIAESLTKDVRFHTPTRIYRFGID